MFCSKCGKEINDDSTFCGFCGAPVNAVPVTNGAPQDIIPQPTVPQPNAPQMSVPQPNGQQPSFTQVNNANVNYNAPQGGIPNQPAQPVSVNLNFKLEPKLIDYINKGLRAVLVVLSLLTIIGSIGTMASMGSLLNGNFMAALNVPGLVGLARVPAIIAFSLSVLGVVFTVLTKQRSLFSYISAGVGIIMFVFNFVLLGGFSSLINLSSGKMSMGGIVVAGIFLIISSLTMIACSVIIILKKEDIVPIKPNF